MEFVAVAVPAAAVVMLMAGMVVSSRKPIRHIRDWQREDLLRASTSWDVSTDYDASEVLMVRTNLQIFQ